MFIFLLTRAPRLYGILRRGIPTVLGFPSVFNRHSHVQMLRARSTNYPSVSSRAAFYGIHGRLLEGIKRCACSSLSLSLRASEGITTEKGELSAS